MIGQHALPVPPPSPQIAAPAMYSGGENQHSPEDLEKRITDYLVAIFRILSNLNQDVSLYLFYHLENDIRRDPLGGTALNRAYNMYEAQTNEYRRLWMSIRATSEKRASAIEATNSTFPSRSHVDPETTISPLEYQSAHGEDELPEIKREDQVTPMDVDPVDAERDLPRPPIPEVDPRHTKPKSKVRLCPSQTEALLTLLSIPESRHSCPAGCDHHPKRPHVMSARTDPKRCKVVCRDNSHSGPS